MKCESPSDISRVVTDEPLTPLSSPTFQGTAVVQVIDTLPVMLSNVETVEPTRFPKFIAPKLEFTEQALVTFADTIRLPVAVVDANDAAGAAIIAATAIPMAILVFIWIASSKVCFETMPSDLI